MKSEKSDFTQGSILKKLVLFMLPILGALVLQAAYGAVDLLVVGHFGSTSGLSAVSTGSQVLNLVTFVVIQFAMGITVLIARYLGEKRPQYIGQVIGGAVVVFALISAALFVVMVGFARPISVLMQAPAEAVDLTASYVRICGGGIFFIVAYNLLSAIFRGLGDSKSPLLFVLVACIVNVFGDLALVAGLHKEDCAILISYSGNSERRLPLKVIPILEEAGVPIIAITGMGDNLLRQHATCVLSMSSRERLYTKISNFATEESINFILNMLYACYFSKDYEKNLDFKTKASRILEFQRFSENSDIQEKPQT